MKVSFTRLDGTEDTAKITARKMRGSGYYVGYIKIGPISKRVTRQKLQRIDAIQDAHYALMRYAENVVI